VKSFELYFKANPNSAKVGLGLKIRLEIARYISVVRSPSHFYRRKRARYLTKKLILPLNGVAPTLTLPWRLRLRLSKVSSVVLIFEKVRPALYTIRKRTLSLDQVLLGGFHGVDASWLAIGSKPSVISIRLSESPHVQLLESHLKTHGQLTDLEIAKSDYFLRGLYSIKLFGRYIGASNEDELIKVCRDFLSWFDRGKPLNHQHRGPKNALPYVRKIKYSNCYAIVDGHHRLAIEYVKGKREAEVVLGLGSRSTALQNRLLMIPWLKGRTELYQPIDSPELETWTLARKCTDRFEMMRAFLEQRGLLPPVGLTDVPSPTYLDVGSFYGWFVKEMSNLGFDASGVELDPLARDIGADVYKIDQEQITISEASAFLVSADKKFDIVSCFSVLHHFALGRGPCSASELMWQLSSSTKSVLFFDTGEAHESWMRNVLPDWTPQFIANWILENSDFTEVIPLGIDGDNRPPYEENYGRTLFAALH
jgi:hypothetical protein